MNVMIGVDPHKGSHTAVAIDGQETALAQLRVRASRRQVDQLLDWAAGFEKRTWAIESAGGLGYLLSQQLVSAGEAVLDVPATLAARVWPLRSGKSNKNDPNDALSVAVAALRARRPGRRGASRPRHRIAPTGPTKRRSGTVSQPDRLPSPRPADGVGLGRNGQRDLRFFRPGHPGQG